MIHVEHFVKAAKARSQQARPAAEKALVEALQNNPVPSEVAEKQSQPELQISPDSRPNHAHPADSQSTAFTDARDQLRQDHIEAQLADLKQKVENYNPQIVSRDGRVDHEFVAKLKKVFAQTKNGSINYTETLRVREQRSQAMKKRKNGAANTQSIVLIKVLPQ